MTYTRTIQIRLSREQHDKIKNDAKANGFNSISNYVRYLALGRQFLIEQKIIEMHKIIVGGEEPDKVRLSRHYPYVNTRGGKYGRKRHIQ